MEDRSSRRLRALVTHMAQRGLSANEIAGALISMMARSNEPRPEAAYIDARPPTASSTKPSCNARPDHTCGSKAAVGSYAKHVRKTCETRHVGVGRHRRR